MTQFALLVTVQGDKETFSAGDILDDADPIQAAELKEYVSRGGSISSSSSVIAAAPDAAALRGRGDLSPDISLLGAATREVILTSPDGTNFRVTVDDSGVLQTKAV